MNLKQLTTVEEAQQVEAFLNKNNIGGGVEAIFIPTYNGPFSPPRDGTNVLKVFFHARLRDERECNCGLVLDLMTRYPDWVVAMLRA